MKANLRSGIGLCEATFSGFCANDDKTGATPVKVRDDASSGGSFTRATVIGARLKSKVKFEKDKKELCKLSVYFCCYSYQARFRDLTSGSK